MVKFLCSVIVLFATPGFTQNLGVLGAIFPIIEQDLLALIEERVHQWGQKSQLLQEYSLSRLEQLRNLKPVSGIIATKKSRVFYYNPSIVVAKDLEDHLGQVFAKAGSVVNPLANGILSMQLVFINGDEPAQVRWAMQLSHQHANVILVAGSPLSLMQKYVLPFYFDRDGYITKTLGIRQVPAKVSPEGQVLKIEEICLDE
jgi:conjugal transfer pilus assembly protein TraW